ncbi:hypothetical protein LX32DRAFT_25240 [Colletotrichum zoysiae]|uniref:Uncharacterized protein n=1 Tax=Colletotrichum zoysiae TaxID=1216348 RepID=A0AAD9HRD7_9PEZI|nr:hypothetical protein LX32DRAFT_25240 [Colletotrichum zoysiae]
MLRDGGDPVPSCPRCVACFVVLLLLGLAWWRCKTTQRPTVPAPPLERKKKKKSKTQKSKNKGEMIIQPATAINSNGGMFTLLSV